MSIKAGWINILETGTTTITSATAGYPAYRLYDRLLGRMWKATSTATQTLKVDQGATTILPVDTIAIPSGHNLAGLTLDFQYSDNDADWSDAVAQWTGAAGIIVKQAAASSTHRYWRFVMAGAAAASQVGECMFTLLTTFSTGPEVGSRTGKLRNASRNESLAGVTQYLLRGSARRKQDLRFRFVSNADRVLIESWVDEWAGTKPFIFEDLDSNQFFAEFAAEPTIERLAMGRANCELSILEIL